MAPQIAHTIAPAERSSPAFSIMALCFGLSHVFAPGNNSTLFSLTTMSLMEQSGMIVRPPIVLTGSFETATVLTVTSGASFLKKRLEFNSAVT